LLFTRLLKMKITKFSTCQDLYYGIQWSLMSSEVGVWRDLLSRYEVFEGPCSRWRHKLNVWVVLLITTAFTSSGVYQSCQRWTELGMSSTTSSLNQIGQ